MKINLAFLGCGRIAKKHIEVFNNSLSKEINLVSVCDKKIELAKNLIIEKNRNVKVYSDSTQMLKENKIDLLSILTESGNHYQNANQALDYVDNIIIEKPVTLRISDAIKLQKKAKRLKKIYL